MIVSTVLYYDPNSALRVQQTEKCSTVELFFRVEEGNCLFLGVCVCVCFSPLRHSRENFFVRTSYLFQVQDRTLLFVCEKV
jgi:hypothetical protein